MQEKSNYKEGGTNCPPYIEIDKDEDKDIELIINNTEEKLQIDIDNNSNFTSSCPFKGYIEEQFDRTLSIHEIEDLEELVDMYSKKELKLCIDEAVRKDKLSIAYIRGILENRDEWGREEY